MSPSVEVLPAWSCASRARRRLVLLVAGGLLIAGCRSTPVVDPPKLSQIAPRTTYDRLFLPPRDSIDRLTAENPWEPPVAARKWRSIVLHHTAGEEGSVASIDSAHRKRVDTSGKAWLGIGYHFVIGNGNGMGDGQIEPTFRWLQQLHGAHAGSYDYNQFGIGIALVGNFENGAPSPAQQEAAAHLVQTLRRVYDIPADQVVAHRDIRATACPGRYFPLHEIAQRSDSDSGMVFPSVPLAAHQTGSAYPLNQSGVHAPFHSLSVSSIRSLRK